MYYLPGAHVSLTSHKKYRGIEFPQGINKVVVCYSSSSSKNTPLATNSGAGEMFRFQWQQDK